MAFTTDEYGLKTFKFSSEFLMNLVNMTTFYNPIPNYLEPIELKVNNLTKI